MNCDLNKFMQCINKIPQLRGKFASCKNLKESYTMFKFMLNGCSYEEYQNFFENLASKTNAITDEELNNVAGGLSLKSMITPVAALGMFFVAATTTSFAFDTTNKDNPNQNITNSGNQDIDRTEEQTDLENENSDDNSESKTVLKGDETSGTEDKKTENVVEDYTTKNDDENIDKVTEKTKTDSENENSDDNSEAVLKGDETSDTEDIKNDNVVKDDTTKNDDKNIDEVTEETKTDTTEGEIAFSLEYIKKLPTDEEGLKEFKKIPSKESFNSNRSDTLKIRNHETNEIEEKTVTLDEKVVYQKIQNVVMGIMAKANVRTPGKDATEDDIDLMINDKKISKNYKLPKELRIAKGIYRWVAKNIIYDNDSTRENKEKFGTNRKAQDPFFVFNQKMGICDGKAQLTNLMMKIAGIPSSYVGSIYGKDEDLGHAFNAIYIEKENEKGWTLIDSTWGSPKGSDRKEEEQEKLYEELKKRNPSLSDSELKKELNEVNKLLLEEKNAIIINNMYWYKSALNNVFLNENDEYVNKLKSKIIIKNKNILDYTYEEEKSIDDKDIDEINNNIKDTLKELNNNYKYKFENIKFKKCENGILVSYITNLSVSDAKNLYKNSIINRIMTKKELYSPNEVYDIFIFGVDQNYNFKLNEKLNEKQIFNSFNSTQNANDISKAIDNFNYNIGSILDEINEGEKYKVEEMKFSLSEDKQQIVLNYKTNITKEDAEKIADDRIKNERIENNMPTLFQPEIKIYFPAFYNENTTLEENNRKILNEPFHKIESVESSTDNFNSNFINYNFIIDNIKYSLYGHETKAYIKIDKNVTTPLKALKIPEEISKFNLPFKIGYRIESLVLEGDQEVDLSDASSLESIDVTKSNKYTVKGLYLYNKVTDNKIGLAKQKGEIDNIEFSISKDSIYLHGDIFNSISLYRKDDKPVRLPQGLVDLNKPFKIGYGIKSLVLEGDQEVDLSEAYDLESIDVTKSNKYTVKGLYLYNKVTDNKIGLAKQKGEIDNIRFSIFSDSISLYGKDEKDKNPVTIPQYLVDLNKPFNIRYGIKSLVLEGDQEVDLSNASDLESIDVTKSNKYTVKGFYLCDKVTDNKIGLAKQKGEIDNIRFSISSDSITLNGKDKNPVTIPQALVDLNKPFKIGYGIKSLVLEGDQEVDLSNASTLKSIDVTKSNKYTVKGLYLYNKVTDNKIGLAKQKGEIDNIRFSIFSNSISLYGKDEKDKNPVTIPQYLVDLNKPFNIGYGIKSLVLEGDQEVDLSEASTLESIDATNSNKYILDENTLYEKTPEGKNGKEIFKIKKEN